MAAALREVGFALTLRTNVGPRDIRAAIREFSQRLKKGGVGLFYFAGYGVQSQGHNYLMPVNADIKEEFELEDQAVDANSVLAGMEEAGNRVNIVILDACRNNPYARVWSSAIGGLAQMSAPSGSFVAFATAPGSVAADGNGRYGVFTQHLLASLFSGDSDIDRVFTRVTAGVARVLANKQVPWKSSSLTGEFRFRVGDQVASLAPSVQAAPADPAAPENELWNSVKDSKNAEDFKSYLDEYPKGRYVVLARVGLRALDVAPPMQVAVGLFTTGLVHAQVVDPAKLAADKSCMACHAINNKVLGPSYKDVAAKYKGNATAEAMLVQKVIKGGSGVWGQIPMPPNVSLKEDEAKLLVK